MKEKRKTKTYNLLTETIIIHYRDKCEDPDTGKWIYGYTVYTENNTDVFISTKNSNGIELDKERIETTVRHELFHVIFDLLYYKDLSDDEHLIEWLAQATQLLNKQGLKI